MTLTKGQGHRSRSNVQKLAKIYKMCHISNAISPKDIILGSKVNPIRRIQWPKCRWPWPKVKVKGQGQIFPKMGKKTKNWSYLGGYFTYRLHTWYQGTTHQCTSNDPSADDLDLRSRSQVKVTFSQKWVKRNKELVISWRLFHQDFIISIITAFCDSFGRCPLVFIIH